jgi:effector-binding domain-containing protein
MRLLFLMLAALLVTRGYVLADDSLVPSAETSPGAPVTLVGDITIREFPAMTAATVLEEARTYLREGSRAQIGASREATARERMLFRGYEKLARWMKNGGIPTGPTFILYEQDPRSVPTAQLRFKIGYPAMQHAKGRDSVKIEELPAMTAAVARFAGPFRESGAIWDSLAHWMTVHGYEPAGPLMEVYLRGMYNSQQPADNFAEVRWPVRLIDGPAPQENALPVSGSR